MNGSIPIIQEILTTSYRSKSAKSEHKSPKSKHKHKVWSIRSEHKTTTSIRVPKSAKAKKKSAKSEHSLQNLNISLNISLQSLNKKSVKSQHKVCRV